ncbi:MAG: hypothetical protein GXO27_04620 [Chlorobi bacterium]|nr:hypothetical protein [Chlorobiota bacterium]
MRKPKLSPETYKQIIDNLKLSTIRLTKVQGQLYEENVLPNATLDAQLKERVGYEQKEHHLKINYSFILKIYDPNSSKPVIEIKATYQVIYQLKNLEIIIPKEFIDIFKEMTVSMMLWPYFRQLAHDLITKMNFPPFVLPMRRIMKK